MRIGDRYSDNRIYRGIRHSNKLPLLSEDLHEFADTIAAKNNYLLESILGSGVLNETIPEVTDTAVRIRTPIVLNIEGDICLLNNSSKAYLTELSRLGRNDRTTKGVIFAVGWYQHITSSSHLRDYGGRMNDLIPTDLVYNLEEGKYSIPGIQVSTRYQFVWDVAIHEGDFPYDGDDDSPVPTVNLYDRDSEGNIIGPSYYIVPVSKVGSIYRADPPTDMSYVVDNVYMIPLFDYEYDGINNSIISISPRPIRKTSSDLPIIQQNVEPVGNFKTGTVWYNPDSREFKTYIEDTGFVSNSAKIGFLQYQYVNVADTNILQPANLNYTIEVPDLEESDIFHVTYEGIVLIRNVDYSIDITNKSITLFSFTRVLGEKLVVTVHRLVETTDVTNMTNILISHTNTNSTDASAGHVKLSDELDESLDSSSGVAATPLSVYQSKILNDTTTGDSYRFIVNNNSLYIENINTSNRFLVQELK